MPGFTLIIDDKPLTDFFARALAQAAQPERLMREVGDYLMASTRARFGAGTGPDGVKWPGNAQSTLEAWNRMKGTEKNKETGVREWKKGWYRKDGSLSARASAVVAGKRPLIRMGVLAEQITFQVEGNALVWGSKMPYAAVQQWGAKQGAFGRDRRNHPIPWGDIPARPYLGLSDTDREALLTIMGRFLLPV